MGRCCYTAGWMGGWMGGFRKAQKRDPLETDAARSRQSATLHLQKRDPLETDAQTRGGPILLSRMWFRVHRTVHNEFKTLPIRCSSVLGFSYTQNEQIHTIWIIMYLCSWGYCVQLQTVSPRAPHLPDVGASRRLGKPRRGRLRRSRLRPGRLRRPPRKRNCFLDGKQDGAQQGTVSVGVCIAGATLVSAWVGSGGVTALE